VQTYFLFKHFAASIKRKQFRNSIHTIQKVLHDPLEKLHKHKQTNNRRTLQLEIKSGIRPK